MATTYLRKFFTVVEFASSISTRFVSASLVFLYLNMAEKTSDRAARITLWAGNLSPSHIKVTSADSIPEHGCQMAIAGF